jgi:fructokinase
MSSNNTLLNNQTEKGTHETLIYGEVLYDCFPDGRRILGGAPFNVAWGLKGFGLNPYFMSAVGEDADGRAIKQTMSEWGMSQCGLQTDTEHATGQVEVSIENDEPSYDICKGRAWDYIDKTAVPSVDLIYHGSLGLRSTLSASSFEAVVDSSKAKRFFDVNLRQPYYSKSLLAKWLKGADWVKLNIDELAYLVDAETVEFASAEPLVDALRARYGIANILLTAGKDGALIKGSYGYGAKTPAATPKSFVDSVGAGDSFTAVTIMGILAKEPVETIIERASEFAAKVCSLRGATSSDPDFYTF